MKLADGSEDKPMYEFAWIAVGFFGGFLVACWAALRLDRDIEKRGFWSVEGRTYKLTRIEKDVQ